MSPEQNNSLESPNPFQTHAEPTQREDGKNPSRLERKGAVLHPGLSRMGPSGPRQGRAEQLLSAPGQGLGCHSQLIEPGSGSLRGSLQPEPAHPV